MIQIKVLGQELLHDNVMWGVGSIIHMEDEGRAKYLLGMLRAEKADGPQSQKPVIPVGRPSNQAEEIGQVIARAMAKGLTSADFERDAKNNAIMDAEIAADRKGRRIA